LSETGHAAARLDLRSWRRAGAIAALLAVTGSRPAPAAAPAASSSSGAVLRIYLARHGQTDWNAQHRLQGSTDTHLDTVGRAQAESLAARLQGVRFDAVYSSMLARTRETAAMVHGSVPIDSLADLNERRLGRFQGFVVDSDSVATAEYRRRITALGDDLGGGETLEQHLARVTRGLDGIRHRHPSGTVLIVSHGLTNQLILKALFHLGWDQANAIAQGNDELYLIELGAARRPRLWKWIGPENLKDL
jgi:2,3-bisphosphoglycerate-dependent phosphoglycerate mutase